MPSIVEDFLLRLRGAALTAEDAVRLNYAIQERVVPAPDVVDPEKYPATARMYARRAGKSSFRPTRRISDSPQA